jgi:hypothetical protein
MSLFQSPLAVDSFGIPTIPTGSLATSGNVFFVGSTATLAADVPVSGATAEIPFATVDYAVGQCTANNGDVIFAMPGHTEDVPATKIVLDVAGVSLIGLGHGNDRPTFTMTASGSRLDLAAAGTRVSNCIFSPGANVTVGVRVVTGGAGAEIDNCEFTVHATHQFAAIIFVDEDDCVIRDCTLNTLDGVSAASGIQLDAFADRCLITRNVIQGAYSTACINGGDVVQITITHNVIANQSSANAILLHNDITGTIAYNSLSARSATLLDSTLFDPGDTLCIENYLCNEVDTHGVVRPQTASTS